MSKRLLYKVMLLATSLVLSSCSSSQLYDLRCEGLDEPIAIDSFHPHFSWKLNGAASQTSYRIQVATAPSLLRNGKADLWDSGEVNSPDKVFIPYCGRSLECRDMCWWRVCVRTASGHYSCSSPQRFGIGIFGTPGMNGDYIGSVPGEGRSAILRKRFTVSRKSSLPYILHINSLGYHEVYINGRRIGDGVLTPAVSQLDKRSLIVSYDISGFIKRGFNEIDIWTGSGWYKPLTFRAGYEGALVKAELDEGKTCILATGSDWEGAFSGYRDLGNWRPWKFFGEEIDAGKAPSGPEEFNRLDWHGVDVIRIDSIIATPQMCELCVVRETVEAVRLDKKDDGTWIADMGRIYNAIPEITLPELIKGDTVKVSFGDHINADGKVFTITHSILIPSGRKGGDIFKGRFASHVFRYAVFEGLTEAPISVKAHRMRTDYNIGGSFECSDPELQSVYDLVAGTMESLAYNGYMVDCANIERLGYGGDGNASTLSLQNMADVGPLYLNWLQAWADNIREDGGLPHTAPCPYRAGGGPYWCTFLIQASWRTYMAYGDTRVLERFYAPMKQWLKYVDKWSRDGLLRKWPNEPYRGWYLGDWLAPEGVDVGNPESVDLVNNCALSQSYSDLIRIADVLGEMDDKLEFENRLESLNSRIHQEFYHPDSGLYCTGSQLDLAYPLLTGVVPQDLRDGVTKSLFERTDSLWNGHIATGLVGIPVLTEWATVNGHADFIYRMLKKHGYPGYLYMIDNGATGTWESWNGDRSQFHNCYNGIGSWFFEALGGIIPLEPGYRRISIRPQRPEGLERVRVCKDTPYGKISVEWDSDGIRYDIPADITIE